MSWFPIGPDFVYAPRDAAPPQRLSRRNEYARQATVVGVAVDPNNKDIMYTVEGPQGGGSGAFRSTDGGVSWTPIADSLQQADPTLVPTCIAVHPINGNYLYLGTGSGAIYVSGTSGASWGAPQVPSPSGIKQIVVDPRNAANPATTVIYAGTGAGLFMSITGGASWTATSLPAAKIWSMAFYMPGAGTAQFYAIVDSQGLYHTTDPTKPWKAVAGVPGPGAFNWGWVDFCLANPNRVYAYFATYAGAVGLYTSGSGATGWAQVVSASLPSGDWLALAPNSPGDGATDILLSGSVRLYRSVDAGRTWVLGGDFYHADSHAFAFSPVTPPMGTIPTTLVGCDGGLVASTGFSDPTYNFAATPVDFSDGATYTASGVAQNRNHGKLTSAVTAYNADPSASAIGYITCWDTGFSGHTSALGWRGLQDADGQWVATTPGSDGVKMWVHIYFPGYTHLLTDHGDFSPAEAFIVLLGGSRINSTSNHALSSDKKCVAGVNPTTFSGPAAVVGGAQTLTPDSMGYIAMGSVINFDVGGNQEQIVVTAVTPTTFTATFARPHGIGVYMTIQQGFVASVDTNGAATQISQTFGQQPPTLVAASPTDPTSFCCATQDNRVLTTSGVVPGPGTVWTDAIGNKPAGAVVAAVAVAPAGDVYVLLATIPGASTTPLYKIAAASWTAQACTGLPAGPFSQLVADPVAANTLYAAAQGRVYRLVLGAGSWAWTAVGPGLPGPPIHDLWVGNIAAAGPAKVLLRAAVASRGVWEADVTMGAVDAPPRPYVRDHFLDQGWFTPPPDGLVNPFRPSDGVSVFHYQCADLKIDAEQAGPPPFFQTDPEGTLPLSHVQFDQLVDNSEHLPGSDAAKVHVQVHNRSYTAADNVSVWAIYASAAAGLPGLNASLSMGNAFPFWSQFQANGTITPSLPADSPWTSVGAPVVLSGIDASHPQVASWSWTVPLLAAGDPGHYCMMVFLHSAANPIGETTNYSVDSITPANPQIGQKNLHIVALGGGGARSGARIREYIEFHNPAAEARVADLVFDLRPLPPQLHMWLRLSELDTVAPLAESLTGIEVTHDPDRGLDVKDALLAGVERGDQVLERLERWLDRLEDRLTDDDDDDDDVRPKHRPLVRLTRPVYRARPAARVAVRGVRLPAHGAGAALMVLANTGELPPGSEYRFQVQQVVHGHVVGGSTYVIRVDR